MSRDLTCLDSFCVAGAVFGEFGVRLPVAGAAPRAILGDSRRAKYCIFSYKKRLQDGTTSPPKRRVRDDDFLFGYPRNIVGISSDIFESSFCWQKHFRQLAGAVLCEFKG